jgi:hypothetical protein
LSLIVAPSLFLSPGKKMNAAAAELLAKQDSARQIEAEIMALTEVWHHPPSLGAKLAEMRPPRL